jgi:hypothetical protein
MSQATTQEMVDANRSKLRAGLVFWGRELLEVSVEARPVLEKAARERMAMSALATLVGVGRWAGRDR